MTCDVWLMVAVMLAGATPGIVAFLIVRSAALRAAEGAVKEAGRAAEWEAIANARAAELARIREVRSEAGRKSAATRASRKLAGPVAVHDKESA